MSMPEGKMALAFQVKNLYHFLQSRGCTRQQHLRKAGWMRHCHSYLSKHKYRLLQSHTPCYLLHQTFLPQAQIPGNDRQKTILGSSSSWKLSLLGWEDSFFRNSHSASIAEFKQCQSEQEGQGHSSSHPTCSMLPEGTCSCTLNFATSRHNAAQTKQGTTNSLV